MGSALLDDPAIVKWLSPHGKQFWNYHVYIMKDFLSFLVSEEFESATPSRLLEFQRKASSDGREHELLDLLQKYILQKDGTYNSLNLRYSKLKTFFKRNRVALPDDDFRIQNWREPVQAHLDVDVIRSLLDAADLGLRAFYLTLWMGILDQERFYHFNHKCGYELGVYLKEKGVDEPFMIIFPGRKQTRNKTFFHTHNGRDALCACLEYFERVRGYPGKGEAALLDKSGKGYGKISLSRRHFRLLEKLNYIKHGTIENNRYGYGLHEFRDVARTLLHLHGKKDGLDEVCVEYWMGHITDKNNYDKFYHDKTYTLTQYKIAEKHLNIISGFTTSPGQDTKELAQQIIKNPEAFKVLQDAMVEIVGAKLAPIEQKEKS